VDPTFFAVSFSHNHFFLGFPGGHSLCAWQSARFYLNDGGVRVWRDKLKNSEALLEEPN
jgi:hypothetical protein